MARVKQHETTQSNTRLGRALERASRAGLNYGVTVLQLWFEGTQFAPTDHRLL